MGDSVQAGTQAGSGPEFGSYKTAAGIDHAASVVEYVTTLSAGNNILQPVTLTSGLPVQPQTGSTWAISAASLPLPALAAKDGVDGTGITPPTGGSGIRGWLSGIYKFVVAMFGTAGTAATAVVTIQGIASMTAVKVDGSGVTQPVNVTQMAGVAPTMGNGASGTGVQRVTIASDSTGQVAQAGTWTVQPGNTPNTAPWLTSVRPATAGGLTTSTLISASSTNATSVKASAGQLYDITVSNTNASPRWFKLYNKASAPTVGSDTPVMTFMIPGSSSGAGLTKSVPLGIAFSTGIAFALTTGSALADTGDVAAGEMTVNLLYA